MNTRFAPTPPGSGGKADAPRRLTDVQGSHGGSQGASPDGAQTGAVTPPSPASAGGVAAPTPPPPPAPVSSPVPSATGPSPATDSAPGVTHGPVEDPSAAMVTRLRKQVDDKTVENGRLREELATLRQNLVDAGHRLGEAEDNCRQTEQRRSSLADAVTEVQTKLAEVEANKELQGKRVADLEKQLQTAWSERDKLAQELAAAKVANPDLELPGKLEEAFCQLGGVKNELAELKAAKARVDTEVEQLKQQLAAAETASVQALKAAKAKASDVLTACEEEADEHIKNLQTEIDSLRRQLRETQIKYWDLLSKGAGTKEDGAKAVKLAEAEAKLAETRKKLAEAEAKLAETRKKLAEAEATWFAEGAGNGTSRQPTASMAAVPADKPGLVKRLFGRNKDKEEM